MGKLEILPGFKIKVNHVKLLIDPEPARSADRTGRIFINFRLSHKFMTLIMANNYAVISILFSFMVLSHFQLSFPSVFADTAFQDDPVLWY